MQQGSEVTGWLFCALLLGALLIIYATPHYASARLWVLPALQIGASPNDPGSEESWQAGDYGQLRHRRYADGSTCTDIDAGPLAIELCR